jgi:hypothetical protein
MFDFEQNTPINHAVAEYTLAMRGARLAKGEPANKKALRLYIDDIPLMLAMDRKQACVIYVRSADLESGCSLPVPSKCGVYVKDRASGEGMHSALRGLPEMDGQKISLYPVNTLQDAKLIISALAR